jgi:hypothetical protein
MLFGVLLTVLKIAPFSKTFHNLLKERKYFPGDIPSYFFMEGTTMTDFDPFDLYSSINLSENIQRVV